ncbi:MAG: nucleoside monophosphate kinase [Patescibacteria group bacterium]|mgnify:CR=1 FL=1
MKNIKQKWVLIIIGPPGAGKGTQGTLLAEKLNLYYFETSKILELSFQENTAGEFIEIGGQKYYFAQEFDNWKKGVLCSPPFVSYLVQEKIRDLFTKDISLLLSGSPRTVFEGEQILPLLEELYGKENIKVILLDIPSEQTIFRNSNRRLCQLMRHPILFNEETKNLKECPLDGSTLMKREGLDDLETINTRLKEYKERTLPLLDYFIEQGIVIRKIDGVGPVDEVFNRACEALK